MKRLELRENPTGVSLLLVTMALLALGAVLVWSALASLKAPGDWYNQVRVRHVFYAVIAGIVACVGWRLDYRRLTRDHFPWPAAILLVVALLGGLLVFVPGIGHRVGDYARWVRIGSGNFMLSFQPSEMIKLTLLIFLAAWLSSQRVNVRSFWTFIFAGAVTLVSVGVVVTQDFGTAAIIGLSAGVTMLLAGVPWYFLVSLLAPAAGAFYFLVVLVPYRWERMLTMMDPWASYQSSWALLAINSGGWGGMGLGHGIIKMGYLPERSTDYIFSVLCEELGMAGAGLLLGLLIVWIWQARKAAVTAPDKFGQLLAGSLSFVIAIQALLHIAVNLAVAPPKGIGLPFVSAGGTSMVILACALALIVSVTASHKTQQAI